MRVDKMTATKKTWKKIAGAPAFVAASVAKSALSLPGLRAVAPDEWYLRARFRVKVGRALRLNPPRTFNEKLQWLKLYACEPYMSSLVDKYEARRYVAEKAGEEYLVPLVGGPWKSFDEIDFDALPEKFVLKTTHDSGGIVVVRDKRTMDVSKARRKIEKALRRNFFWVSRETPYRPLEPRVIAEKLLDGGDGDLRDYKFYVFNGKTRMINVCSQRFAGQGLRITFYDDEWNLLPFERRYPRERVAEPRPEAFDRLKELAAALAGDLSFARIDFYLPKGEIYVGEITLFPGAGFEPFDPEKWDETVGEWLTLPGGKR